MVDWGFCETKFIIITIVIYKCVSSILFRRIKLYVHGKFSYGISFNYSFILGTVTTGCRTAGYQVTICSLVRHWNKGKFDVRVAIHEKASQKLKVIKTTLGAVKLIEIGMSWKHGERGE